MEEDLHTFKSLIENGTKKKLKTPHQLTPINYHFLALMRLQYVMKHLSKRRKKEKTLEQVHIKEIQLQCTNPLIKS